MGDETPIKNETLWHSVMHDVKPYRALLRPNLNDKSKVKKHTYPKRRNLHKALPSTTPLLTIEAKTLQKLRRGKLVVKQSLDLHGYTTSQAHRAVIAFLQRAHRDNLRLTLIITGKGQKETSGTIRRELPFWLEQAPLASIINAFSPAPQSMGGLGATLIRLKKNPAKP